MCEHLCMKIITYYKATFISQLYSTNQYSPLGKSGD